MVLKMRARSIGEIAKTVGLGVKDVESILAKHPVPGFVDPDPQRIINEVAAGRAMIAFFGF